MNGTKNYYFGTYQGLLEPISLNYLSFGALWLEDNDHRYIVGYGFGKNQIETLRQFSNNTPYTECFDQKTIYEVYRSIRETQQAQDWSTRLSFPLSTAFREPWKGVASGWYVMKSRSDFPLHLSVVHKKNYRVWLEHTAVCENESELLAFVEKARNTHHVDLKLMES